MTGNTKIWRAPLAGLASVAMIATMGMAAATANAAGEPTFKATFDTNGRGTVTNATEELNYNNSQPARSYKLTPQTPDYSSGSDWTFTGWYTEPGLGEGEKVDFTAPHYGDMTLYAHWAKTSEVKTIMFTDNSYAKFADTDQNGTASEGTDRVVKLAPGDKLASWEIPTDKAATDHTLLQGWYDSTSASQADYDLTAAPEKSVTLSPKTVNSFAVKFSASASRKLLVQGGKTDGYTQSSGETYDVEVAENTALSSFPVAVDSATGTIADGDKFITIWNATSGASGAWKLGNKVTTDMTLTADTANGASQAYQVDYKVDPAFYPVASKFVPEGSSIPTPDLSEIGGLYKAGNWTYKKYVAKDEHSGVETKVEYVDEKVEDVNKYEQNKDGNPTDRTVALSTVLTPLAAEQVTVTFDPNYSGSKTTQVKYDEGTSVSEPTEPTRDGYVFMGWYKDADASKQVPAGTGANKLDFEDLTADADIVYYAGWLKDTVATDIVGAKNLTPGMVEADEAFTTNSVKAYTKAYNKAMSDADLTAAENAALADGASLSAIAKFTDTDKADALLKGLQSAQALLKAKSTVPVYRVFNKDTNKHLYTTDAAEAAALMAAGWRDEGVAFNVAASVHEDDNVVDSGMYVPVYRLFNKYDASGKQIDRHFYTSDKAEYEKLVADPSWRDEGIAYYVRTQGGETVYRAYSSDRYEHLFTTNKTEAQNAVKLYGYRDEGVAFNAE